MRSFFKRSRAHRENEKGSIDLPSIMIGSILSLALAGAAAISIVTVTTSTGNNTARATAETIAMAQKSYFSANDRFGSQSELIAAGSMKGQDPSSYCVSTPADGSSFLAATKTSKGRMFTITEPNPNSVKDAPEGTTEKYCFP